MRACNPPRRPTDREWLTLHCTAGRPRQGMQQQEKEQAQTRTQTRLSFALGCARQSYLAPLAPRPPAARRCTCAQGTHGLVTGVMYPVPTRPHLSPGLKVHCELRALSRREGAEPGVKIWGSGGDPDLPACQRRWLALCSSPLAGYPRAPCSAYALSTRRHCSSASSLTGRPLCRTCAGQGRSSRAG